MRQFLGFLGCAILITTSLSAIRGGGGDFRGNAASYQDRADFNRWKNNQYYDDGGYYYGGINDYYNANIAPPFDNEVDVEPPGDSEGPAYKNLPNIPPAWQQ